MPKYRILDTHRDLHTIEAHRMDVVEDGRFLDFTDEKGRLVMRFKTEVFHSVEVELESVPA